MSLDMCLLQYMRRREAPQGYPQFADGGVLPVA